MRLSRYQRGLVEELDLDVLCEGMNLSPEAARRAIREGMAAGLLRIEATANEIRLIATFPDEPAS